MEDSRIPPSSEAAEGQGQSHSDTGKSRRFATFLAVVGLCVLALGSGLWLRHDATQRTPQPPDVAWDNPAALALALDKDAAQAFSAMRFTRMDGTEMTLAELRGRPVLLNFWASWCAPCVKEMPDLDKLAETYTPHGLQVLVASLDASPAVAKDFLAMSHLTHVTPLMDTGGRQFARLRQGVLPLTLLIRPDSSLAERINGFRRWNGREMLEKIHALCKPSAPETTR